MAGVGRGERARRVVVITGASAGVGRAAAVEFAKRGDAVGLIARGAVGLAAAREEVEAAGGEGFVVPIDVADPEAVDGAAAAIEDRFGRIDVWVNNASASVVAPVGATTPEEFRRATEVTYLGTVYGTMAALRRMAPRNTGWIIQVSSTRVPGGQALHSAHWGAKQAIHAFTESLREELAHDHTNIQMTVVSLPPINTPGADWSRNKTGRRVQPSGRVYQPEVAARAIVWAAEHRRKEIVVAAPGLVEHIPGRNGYGQLGHDHRNADERDNLFEPLDAGQDTGSHGRLDDGARSISPGLWASMHRQALSVAAGVAGAGVALATLRRRR
jgi:NAD(P)-dependent dehydrogenase (short-subunit alcohol dehydrogenase family)